MELAVPRFLTSKPSRRLTTPITLSPELSGYRERQLGLIRTSCLSIRETALEDTALYNSSIKRMRKAFTKPVIPGRVQSRVHRLIELRVADEARRLGKLPPTTFLGGEHKEIVQRAAFRVARDAKLILGRPDRWCLAKHVEMLMALAEEIFERPVIGKRTRNSVYDPHFGCPGGMMIRDFFADVDPRLTETALVNIVREIRTKNQGETPMLSRLMPHGERLSRTPDGTVQIESPTIYFRFAPAVPLYCP